MVPVPAVTPVGLLPVPVVPLVVRSLPGVVASEQETAIAKTTGMDHPSLVREAEIAVDMRDSVAASGARAQSIYPQNAAVFRGLVDRRDPPSTTSTEDRIDSIQFVRVTLIFCDQTRKGRAL
jgi:hypothetical protein